MADLGTLRVTVVADLKKFSANMTKASSGVKRFSTTVVSGMERAKRAIQKFALSAGRSLVRFTRKWLRRAVIAMFAFGAAAVKMAIDVEEGENLIQESFKGMTGSVIDWSNTLQRELGLNAVALRESAGLMNLQTKSMGLTTEQAYLLATSINEVAINVASLRNQKLSVTLEKMQSALLGMPRPLRDIGITTGEAAIKQLLLDNNLKGSMATMTEAQKIMARYILILQQTETDAGDLARTADSTQNAFRIFGERVKTVTRRIGRLLLPTVNMIALAMRDWLADNEERIIAWADTAVKKFTAFINFLRGDYQQGFKGSLDIMLIIAGTFTDALVAVFKDTWERIGSQAMSWFWAGFKKHQMTRLKVQRDIAKQIAGGLFGPAAGVIASVAEDNPFEDAAKSGSNFNQVLTEMDAKIKAVIEDTKEFAATNAMSAEELAAQQEKRIAREKKMAADAAEQNAKRIADMNAMTEQFVASMAESEAATAAINNVDMEPFVNEFRSATDQIKEMFANVAQVSADIVTDSTAAVGDAFVKMFETMATDMDNFGDAVKTFLKSMMREIALMQARLLATKILGSSEEGGGGLGGIFGAIFKGLAGGAGGGGGAQAKARGGIVQPVYAAAGFAPRGTDTVPAMLTPGEGVLSKDLTGALREQLAVPGGVNAAPPLVIQVQTIDAQSTAQWLNNNKRLLAGMLNETRRANNPAARRHEVLTR